MQKISFADGADLAIAKKAGQTDWPKPLLDHLGVVVGPAKEILSTSVATAQATAVNGHARQLSPGAREQFIHVLRGGRRRTFLELDGLAQPRQGAHGDAAGARVGPQQITNQKIAAMEFVQILVGNQADW